jgi:hypothetical protein
MEGAYNGSQGYVARHTSVTRNTGDLESVLDAVKGQGYHGMTWHELGDWLGLHHGQASGALSNLHKKGLVFVMRDVTRKKCQVYVTSEYKSVVPADKRIDEPAKIKNTIRLQALIQAAEAVIESGTPMDILLLEIALDKYKTNS